MSDVIKALEAWPEPIVTNPDIANPTGLAYIDCLLHRLLDAQQDINVEKNERMSQSLCNASELIDEVECALRKLAALASLKGGVAEDRDAKPDWYDKAKDTWTDRADPPPADYAGGAREALERCHRVFSFDLRRMIESESADYNQAVRDAWWGTVCALAALSAKEQTP